MKKYGEEKWGQLGECTLLRFSPDYIRKYTGRNPQCGSYSIEQFELNFGVVSLVPVEIAEDVEGNYEAVCEHGIEIR